MKKSLIKYLVSSCISLLVLALWLGYRHFSEKSQSMIEQIEHRLGLKISYNVSSMGLNSIKVENIATVGEINSAIRSIDITTVVGSKHPEKIKIEGANIGLTLSQWHTLFQLKTRSAGHQPPSERSEKQLALPDLQLDSPSARLYDNQHQLMVELKDFSLNTSQGKGSFHASEVILADGPTFKNIQGSLLIEGSLSFPEVYLRLDPEPVSKGHYHLRLKIDPAKGSGSLYLRNLESLPPLLPLLGEQLPIIGTPRVGINANFLLKDNAIHWNTSFALANLRINHPQLAPYPVGPISLSGRSKGGWNPSEGTLQLEQANLKIGSSPNQAIALIGRFSSKKIKQGYDIHGNIELPPTSCQNLARSLPTGFRVDEQGLAITGGVLGAKLAFHIDSRTPEDFEYKLTDARFDCQFRANDGRFSRAKLIPNIPIRSRFQRRSRYQPKAPPSFTKLEQIPLVVRDSFLVSEDVGFFSHSGFSEGPFIEAMRRNLKEGRLVLGGSTISMQTAKNLWLDGGRNVSRKLKEAFYTRYLEQTLPKERILEIYLNIIEFGPGIFGISNASEHFFDKKPEELSLKEATYLASVLPSPIGRYTYFCKQHLSANYEKLMQQKLETMYRLKRIDQEAFEEALVQPLQFSHKARTHSPHCPGSLSSSQPSFPSNRETL